MCFIGEDGAIGGVDDDAFVQNTHGCVSYNPDWFGGVADPLRLGCTPGISAQWRGTAGSPHGFDHHPVSRKPYVRLSAQSLTIDNDNDGGAAPCNAIPPTITFGTPVQGIMAYDPRAPFMDMFWNAPGFSDLPDGDFCFWVQKSTHDQILAIQMTFPSWAPWSTGIRAVAFDRLPVTPLTTGESPRTGMSVGGIADMCFDDQSRFIFAIPGANTVAITEPHTDESAHIIIQKEIGGLQNGDGTQPTDLQGPASVDVDPRSQDILVADTGHDRIVIFTSSGTYKRQFVTGANPYMVRVDNFGRIFVATRGAGNDGEGGGLSIYDEFGKTPIFGSIEGLVKDSQTNRNISRGLVRINYPTSYSTPNADPNNPATNPFLSQQALTDDAGYFRFSQVVLADQLGITATRAGYVDATVSVDVTPGKTTTVEIVMVPENTNSPGFGVVTGTLQSSKNGSPLANFNVGIQGTGISDRTNGAGEFAILGVPAGTQTVVVSANGTIVYTQPGVAVADGQTKDLGAIEIDI
jgi:hypothetical protein